MANRNHIFVVKPYRENNRDFVKLVIQAKSSDVDREFTLTFADVNSLHRQLNEALVEVYRWRRS